MVMKIILLFDKELTKQANENTKLYNDFSCDPKLYYGIDSKLQEGILTETWRKAIGLNNVN